MFPLVTLNSVLCQMGVRVRTDCPETGFQRPLTENGPVYLNLLWLLMFTDSQEEPFRPSPSMSTA